MFEDEGRFGTMTTIGRQWCEKGSDFIIKTKQGRENMYSYAAASPKSGHLIVGNYEKANTDTQKIFLELVSKACKNQYVLMFMDRAAWHTTDKLAIPDNIQLVFLPPTSPQLNPIEHLWKHIRTEYFHNIIFDSIANVYQALNDAVNSISEEKVKSLCACIYL